MKKVMFYTKHIGVGSAGQAVKNSGMIILFYTCFVCALLIGSKLFISAGNDSFLDRFAAQLLDNKIEHTAVLLLCCALLTVFIGISAGLSCSGSVILLLLPFAEGLLLSLIITYLLVHSGAKGLGYFSLLILPGAILFITATLAMCAINAASSKKICGILFFEQKEALRIRALFVRNAVVLCAMLLSVLVTYLLYIMFAALFQ
jgi:hypothetical protein